MYLIVLSVKQGGFKYQFLSLWYEIETGSPSVWRILYPLGQCRLIAERNDIKSNKVWAGFDPRLRRPNYLATLKRLWYNETDCLWMTIYIYNIYIYTHTCTLHIAFKKLQWVIQLNIDEIFLPCLIPLTTEAVSVVRGPRAQRHQNLIFELNINEYIFNNS